MPPIKIELDIVSDDKDSRAFYKVDRPVQPSATSLIPNLIDDGLPVLYGVRCNPEDDGGSVTKYSPDRVGVATGNIRTIPGPEGGKSVAEIGQGETIEIPVVSSRGEAVLRVVHYDV